MVRAINKISISIMTYGEYHARSSEKGGGEKGPGVILTPLFRGGLAA